MRESDEDANSPWKLSQHMNAGSTAVEGDTDFHLLRRLCDLLLFLSSEGGEDNVGDA